MSDNVETMVLSITGKYDTYTDFYDENKTVIYNNIVKLFENFKNKAKDQLVLKLSADIENISGEIELKFTRKDIHLLRKDVLFYFESLEDYETCNYVQKLCEIIE